MPQLMPFFWMNSLLMIFTILITFVFFYFFKHMEIMEFEFSNKEIFKNSILLW